MQQQHKNKQTKLEENLRFFFFFFSSCGCTYFPQCALEAKAYDPVWKYASHRTAQLGKRKMQLVCNHLCVCRWQSKNWYTAKNLNQKHKCTASYAESNTTNCCKRRKWTSVIFYCMHRLTHWTESGPLPPHLKYVHPICQSFCGTVEIQGVSSVLNSLKWVYLPIIRQGLNQPLLCFSLPIETDPWLKTNNLGLNRIWISEITHRLKHQ